MTTPATPFVRDVGRGPVVLCLHSNASSSGKLRGLMEALAPLLNDAGEPIAVVGHSCGAALALHVALVEPQRVGVMVLIEPTRFPLAEPAASRPPRRGGGRRGRPQ